MARVVVEKQVQAPVDTVFARATNLAEAADTIRGIDRMEILTDGSVGVGTRFRETRTMFGREATEVMEISSFDPPRAYTVEAHSHGSHYHTEFHFHPEGDGTRMEMVFEAHPQSFMAKVMSILSKPMMKSVARMCAQDMEDIKTAAERSAGH